VHIALLHHTYPPVPGGVERVLQAHARLFAAAGHDVRVIAGFGTESVSGIRIECVPELLADHPTTVAAREEVTAGPPGRWFKESIEGLRPALHRLLAGCDAVFAHNLLTMPFHPAATAALAQIAAGGAGERWGGRFFHWLHDAAYANPDYRLPTPDRFPWDLMTRPLPGVRTIAVSEHRARQWRGLAGPDAVSGVIPNGVDPAGFLVLPPALADWCEGTRLFDRELVLLHPARLVRRKNIELSIRTTQAIGELGCDALLIVTGAPDPHQSAGEAYANELALGIGADAVAFPGGQFPIGEAELSGLYRLADALLFPSRSEGFGIPPLEAALYRLPMFLSRAAALNELPFSNVTWFEPDIRPDQLAARILERMGGDSAHANRRRTLRDYRWSRIFERQVAPLLLAEPPAD